MYSNILQTTGESLNALMAEEGYQWTRDIKADVARIRDVAKRFTPWNWDKPAIADQEALNAAADFLESFIPVPTTKNVPTWLVRWVTNDACQGGIDIANAFVAMSFEEADAHAGRLEARGIHSCIEISGPFDHKVPA